MILRFLQAPLFKLKLPNADTHRIFSLFKRNFQTISTAHTKQSDCSLISVILHRYTQRQPENFHEAFNFLQTKASNRERVVLEGGKCNRKRQKRIELKILSSRRNFRLNSCFYLASYPFFSRSHVFLKNHFMPFYLIGKILQRTFPLILVRSRISARVFLQN
jgi:hypothetical protein